MVLALTVAQLDEIIATAAQGKSVTFGDRSYTAQDLPDLLALRATLAAQEAAAAGTPRHYRLAATSKGV